MLTPRLRDALENDIKIVPGRAGPRDDTGVRGVLESTHRAALRLSYLAAGLVLLLFIVMVVFLARNADNTVVFTAISSASGLGFGGLIIMLMSNIRETVQAGILIALAGDLPSQDRKDAFKVLLSNRERLVAEKKSV